LGGPSGRDDRRRGRSGGLPDDEGRLPVGVLHLDDRARARRQARELQRLARAGEEGKKLTATGTLKIDGKVLSGAAVKIYFKADGASSYALKATATTNSKGAYSTPPPPTTTSRSTSRDPGGPPPIWCGPPRHEAKSGEPR
jgi:hypothetical protein